MKKAIYPGTFDPVTLGHIDLIKRALEIFDGLIVAVASNPSKKPLFSKEERVRMLKEATVGLEGLIVDDFSGLVTSYAKKKKIDVILRGIRAFSDFEYEFQMALTNRKLMPNIETMFLMPSQEYSYFSSNLIKEAAGMGGDVSSFVPSFVAQELKKRLNMQ